MPDLPPLIIGSNGYVASINPSTGEELWRTPLQQGFLSSTSHSDVSVLVVGGIIFAGSRGHLFCLAVEDGAIIWSNDLKGMGYNDVSLAIQGVSVQFIQKVEQRSSGSNAG
jgi:outer membrane protein assembly factor BamB